MQQTRARMLVETFAAERPRAVELAELASMAVRAESALLRRLRLEMLPGAGPEVEADVWHGPLVGASSVDGVVFKSDVGSLLRRRLAARDRALYERAWEVTREVHEQLPATLRCEEQLNYLQFAPGGGVVRGKALLRSAIRSIVSEKNKDVARWAAGAMERLPADVRASEEGRMLLAAARLHMERPLVSAGLPEGLSVEQLEWLGAGARDVVHMRVRAGAGVLEIGPAEAEAGEGTIAVPRTKPMWVEVADGDRRVSLVSSLNRDNSQLAGLTLGLLELGIHPEHWNITDMLRMGTRAIFELPTVLVVALPVEMGSGRDEESRVVALLRGSMQWNVIRHVFWLIPSEGVPEDKIDDLSRVIRSIVPLARINVGGSAREVADVVDDSFGPSAWKRLDIEERRSTRTRIEEAARIRNARGDIYAVRPPGVKWLESFPDPERHLHVFHQQKLEQAMGLLARTGGVVVVSGESGSGKTQFALRLAQQNEERFREHIYIRLESLPPGVKAREARRLAQHLAATRRLGSSGSVSIGRANAGAGRLVLIEDLDERELSIVESIGETDTVIVTSREVWGESGVANIVLGPIPEEEMVRAVVQALPNAVGVPNELATMAAWTPAMIEQLVGIMSKMDATMAGRLPRLLRAAMQVGAALPDPLDGEALEVMLGAMHDDVEQERSAGDADPEGFEE